MRFSGGSGLPEEKSEDIIVTTLEMTAVGGAGPAAGTHRTDRDSGARSVPSVLTEGARISG
jgi:hypothetical protein